MLEPVLIHTFTRQLSRWRPTPALVVIWAPTYFAGWCERLLFRHCHAYRRYLTRKRLSA